MERTRARRDPEGRRRAIVEAAARVILETGSSDISHRMVAKRAAVPLGATTQYFATLDDLRNAALARLAEQQERDLVDIGRELEEAGGRPEAVARLVHDYLSSGEQVRLDTVLFTAAMKDAALRPLALQWFEGFTAILGKYTDPGTAQVLAVFLDGATVHASMHDEPLGLELLTHVVEKLWSRT